MSIQQLLEKEHSRPQTERVVGYIGKDEVRFAELMRVVLANQKTIAQRAAWCMSLVAIPSPYLFLPYLDRILRLMQQPNAHDSIVRNTLKILEQLQIPEHVQGELVDTCLGFIMEPNKPPAIKAFAISTLQNICRQHPELAPEIRIILTERIESEKPAFQSRARRFLKEFSGNI